jgi:hypothetical protein
MSPWPNFSGIANAIQLHSRMNTSPNPLDRFLTIPNRDAYATIRGFVYQAVLTIQAWLCLSRAEMLELEAGEDIDWKFLAERAISSRRDAERVLGQVKYRGTGLSLRSEVSLASLVTFHQHRARNPRVRLQFRLLSNAKIVQERGHVHPSGLKGIELWTSLTAITDSAEQKTRLAFLRGVLLAPSEPPSVDRKQLQEFRTFVRTGSDEEFLDFVASFAWMKTSTDLESAFASAEQTIRTRQELRGFEQAAPLCLQALLHRVLLVLSQPGTKELRPETCTEILQGTQQQATEAVAYGLTSAREKISQGAAAFANLTQQLGDIVSKLGTQAASAELAINGISSSPAVIPGNILPILEAPNLVSPTAPRSDLRKRIVAELDSKGAGALIGDVACGKSQLALLSAEGIEHVTWLSLRANNGIDPNSLLDAALLRCLQSAPKNGAAGSRGLVIDDLEIGLASRKFCDRLLLIARELRKRGTVLLVCSTGRLPSSLQDQIPPVPVGGYEDDDIQVLLEFHGAPPRLNHDGFRALISSVTGAHPVLVGALIQFLIQRQWNVDDNVLDGLLSRSFSQDVRQEMQSRLLAEGTPGAKELLYRVSLASRPITQDQALTLAEIAPAISNRNEQLTMLLDTWLQRSGANLVLASPLVANLGDRNLSLAVRQQVHDRLAGWILKSKSLSQADAILCISHLMAAGKARGAGLILVQGLQAMLPLAEKLKDTSLLRVWRNLPLPKAMGYEICIMIRGYQVAIAGLLGESVDYEFDDLLALAKQASGDFGHLSAFGACSAIAIHLGRKAPSLSLRAVVVALEHEAALLPEQRFELQTDFGLAATFWLIGCGCTTEEEILNWLTELGRIPEQLREGIRNSDIAPQSAWMIFQKLWIEEQRNAEEERDWPSLMTFLRECESRASKAGIALLEASAFRVQQSIRIVHFKEPEQGDRLAWERIESFSKGGSEDFLISEGTAIWLTDADRWDLALPWFNRAAECVFDGLDSLRMQNQLRRTEALYRAGQDPQDGFAQALNIAEQADELKDLDIVLCLVEKAMWQWLKGDHLGCLHTWDRALVLVLAQDRTTARWKNLFVLMGNHTSVFSGVDTGGTRADLTLPIMGLYLRDYDISGMYSDATAWFVPAMMVSFADRLGDAKLAAKWALKTVETGDALGADPKSRFVLRAAVVPLLRARDYDGAINFARDAAVATAVRPQYNISAEMREMKPELTQSENNWKTIDSEQCEGWAIVTAVLPALIDIVALSISDDSTGYTLLGSLTDKCREVATQQNSPSWQAAAEALTDLATGTIDWSVEFRALPDDDRSATTRQVLLAFGSGFVCRRTPRDVFVQQVRWTPWLQQYFGSSKAQSADVADGLSRYWLALIDRDPFYFRFPEGTKRDCTAAAESHRVESIFKAVAGGLSLSLPKWLNDLLGDG